eukprot:CAMPEP_0119009886 /NCGR_PEP_ID=MMETSP1176-20130426/4659_1 /TAXON_ID=265551 /ORGANISM="Synedropsis recta cf, Strain CCMP1620" /LENGTH=443 /DNA_ID=CAMNT_0006962469 /DNA_START=66 /DNA_END=1397 /DNA_ORIENTATION=-
MSSSSESSNTNTKAYLTIGLGSNSIGTLELELYEKDVPKTVRNFCAHLTKKNGAFRGSKFHRIIPKFMAQGGDFTNGDGTGGTSIYGDTFDDESFVRKHAVRGQLSMANSGPNTNGSQFFITFKPTPHLDGKHVVFGEVVAGEAVLQAMEKVPTGRNNVPKVPLVVLDCGVRNTDSKKKGATVTVTAADDDNEIELDEEEEETSNPAGDDPSAAVEEEEEPISTGNSLKDRLRRLKMKMNQARQLNRQEVQREGERLGSEEGKEKEQFRLKKQESKRREADWQARNAKAVELATAEGYEDGKFLVEPADKSLARAQKRADTEERNRYSAKDYHNPEGQHRHYERNIKSIPRNMERGSETDIYSPISAATTTSSNQNEDGAKRLANELKRRIEKQKKKRDRIEFEGEDITSINKRNKHFNKKISRNYDEATADIRQSLERGTAL